MKHFLFVLIFLNIFTHQSFAKGEKKIGYRKDVFLNANWTAKDSIVYNYNLDTMQTLQLSLKGMNANDWNNNFRYSSTYGVNKKISSQLRENWNGTMWVNFNKYEYQYDAADNNTIIDYFVWNISSNNWNPTGRIVYTSYDSFGNFGKEEVFSWNGSNWSNLTYTTYTYYTATIKLQNKDSYYWDNTSGWKKDERFFYNYNQDSISIITHSIPDTNNINNWVSDKRYLSNYTFSPFRLSEYIVQKWDTAAPLSGYAWMNQNRTSYSYAISGVIDKTTYQLFDGINWNTFSQNIFVYNANQEVSDSYIEQNNGNGVFDNVSKSSFQYNNGNPIEELQYLGNGSSWNLNKRISATFNSKDDISFRQVDIFSGNYVPDYREFFYYINGPLSVDNEIVNNNSIKIFPNPCQDFFNIELENNENFASSISIYDINSRLVWQRIQTIAKGKSIEKIPTDNLISGNYFVQIRNLQNQTSQSFKIQVNK